MMASVVGVTVVVAGARAIEGDPHGTSNELFTAELLLTYCPTLPGCVIRLPLPLTRVFHESFSAMQGQF